MMDNYYATKYIVDTWTPLIVSGFWIVVLIVCCVIAYKKWGN